MNDVKTIRARIRLLSASEGGRQTPVRSGYRPAFHFGEKQTDGAILLTETEEMLPGTEVTATVKLLHPEQVGEALHKNSQFVVKEGGRAVAKGRVLPAEALQPNVVR